MQKASTRAQRITTIEEAETARKKEMDGWTYADQKKATENSALDRWHGRDRCGDAAPELPDRRLPNDERCGGAAPKVTVEWW